MFSFFFWFFKPFSFFSDYYLIFVDSKFLVFSIMVTFIILFFLEFINITFKHHVLKMFFFFFINLFVFNIFFSNNIFYFFFSVEIMIIPMAFLVYNWSTDMDKISSVVLLVLMNSFSSVPFMFFLFYCNFYYSSFFNFFFFEFFNSFFYFIMFSMLILFKMPLFFYHFWLSKAHVSASGFNSILLASLLIKISTSGLINFSNPLFFFFFKFVDFFFFFSSFSCFIISIIFFRLMDLKLFLALSSVSHMCCSFPFLMSHSYFLFLPSVFMFVSHSFTSGVGFFLVSKFYEGNHSRSMIFLKSKESWSKISFFILLFCLFFNMGVPPLASFMFEVFSVCGQVSLFFVPVIFFFFFMLLSCLFLISLIRFFVSSTKFFLLSSKVFFVKYIILISFIFFFYIFLFLFLN